MSQCPLRSSHLCGNQKYKTVSPYVRSSHPSHAIVFSSVLPCVAMSLNRVATPECLAFVCLRYAPPLVNVHAEHLPVLCLFQARPGSMQMGNLRGISRSYWHKQGCLSILCVSSSEGKRSVHGCVEAPLDITNSQRLPATPHQNEATTPRPAHNNPHRRRKLSVKPGIASLQLSHPFPILKTRPWCTLSILYVFFDFLLIVNRQYCLASSIQRHADTH